jgi:hypothetical protein
LKRGRSSRGERSSRARGDPPAYGPVSEVRASRDSRGSRSPAAGTDRPRCGFFLAAAFWAGVQRGFLGAPGFFGMGMRLFSYGWWSSTHRCRWAPRG